MTITVPPLNQGDNRCQRWLRQGSVWVAVAALAFFYEAGHFVFPAEFNWRGMAVAKNIIISNFPDNAKRVVPAEYPLEGVALHALEERLKGDALCIAGADDGNGHGRASAFNAATSGTIR